MSEVFDRVDNLNKTNNEPKENQVDKFSQTTKLLDKELNDKKENILKVLEEGNLKEIFENLLSSEDGELCINSLLECENNEEKIKKVIFANLPEGYAYNVSTNEVVKTEKKNVNDYTGAITMDKEKEQAEEKKEQAVQNEEQAVQNEKRAVQNKEKSEEEMKVVEIIRSANEAKAKRDELRLKYDGLQQKTDKGSDLYNEVEKNLKNSGVLNQLEEIGKSIKDSNFVENYISLQATLQELKSNPTIYESSDISSFDKIVKNLENSCNIPDTNLNSFDSKNISQTRTELFNEDIGNDSLISAKKSNMESHDYSEIFPEKIEDDELIVKYGNFLEGNLKTFWQNYKNNPDEIKNKVNEIKNNPNPTDEDERFLQIYNYMIAELDKKRKETEEQTKNMMEELCIISQIKGMYMCMGEGADFNLNKAREIESEDGILTLRGHIDGVDFVIRQDTTKGSPLQISSKLYKNNESLDDTDKNNDFIIGGKDKFVNSNFILPTQDEIFTMITENIKSDNLLQNADNYEKYLEILQNNIMVNIDNKYEKTKYAHHYMQEQVKGEKIIDKTISFVEKLKGADIDSRINNSSVQLYNFLNLMDFNIKHSTSAEKDKLYRIMDKIDKMTSLAQYNSSDGELLAHQDKFSQYLTGDSLLNTRSTLKGNQVEGSNKYAFDLFKNYENLSDERKIGKLHMINFDQMLIDLNKVEIQQKEEQEEATGNLALSELDEALKNAYA